MFSIPNFMTLSLIFSVFSIPNIRTLSGFHRSTFLSKCIECFNKIWGFILISRIQHEIPLKFHPLKQCFSTSGWRPHLGSPSDFRVVAHLSTNFLKNDIRTKKYWPNSPTYSTDVGVLRGWGPAQITVRHFGSRGKKG